MNLPSLPQRTVLFMFALIQTTKLLIILSQPNSEQFKYWFYRCFQYPPYSWDCRTLNENMPFPMPYSLIWYIVYVPLTAAGYWAYNLVMLLVDTLFGWVMVTKHNTLWAYFWTQGSLYFLIVAPQDFLIWTFILLGRTPRYGLFFLSLAIAAKFPLLPPILDPAIWGFIFGNPLSARDPLNYARYIMLGTAWVSVLVVWLLEHGHLHIPINRRYIRVR